MECRDRAKLTDDLFIGDFNAGPICFLEEHFGLDELLDDTRSKLIEIILVLRGPLRAGDISHLTMQLSVCDAIAVDLSNRSGCRATAGTNSPKNKHEHNRSEHELGPWAVGLLTN